MQVNGTGRSLRWTAPISSEKIKKASKEGKNCKINITAKEILYDSLWLINKLNECLDHILYGDAKEKAVSCILDIVRMQCNFEYNAVRGEKNFNPKQEITSATERYDELKAMLPEALRDKICPQQITKKQHYHEGMTVTVTLVIQPETQTSENPFRLELAFEYTEEDNHEATDLTTPPAREMSQNIRGSLSKSPVGGTGLGYDKVLIVLTSNDGDEPGTTPQDSSLPKPNMDDDQSTVVLPGQEAGMDALPEEDSLATLGELFQLQGGKLEAALGEIEQLGKCQEQCSQAEGLKEQQEYADQAIRHFDKLKAMLPEKLRGQICPTPQMSMESRNQLALRINDGFDDRLGENIFIFQMIPKPVEDYDTEFEPLPIK